MDEQKKLFGSVGYTILFIVSFLFFVFMTFPYSVLKESVVSQISEQTGLNIRIQEFGPAIPLGFYAEKVAVTPAQGGPTLQFEKARVSLSIFRLFIGDLAVNVQLATANKGTLNSQASWKIWKVITGRLGNPRRLILEANRFDLGNSMDFLLKYSAQQANDLIKGVLNQMSLTGILNGDMQLVMASDDPIQSSGEVNLEILNGVLDLNDPNLNIPAQNFSKALIRANLKGGRFVLDNSSGLAAEEISIALNGSANLRHPLDRSILDIDINLQLQGTLKDNFGFLLSMMGSGSDESANYKLTGTMGRPAFNPI